MNSFPFKKILLAHGSGGKLMHTLIEELFKKKFKNILLDQLDDSAVIPLFPHFPSDNISSISKADVSVCFTTDSYVVNPLFFPGGDIGKLSICGTINDLLVCGARPLYISCGFIIEEGLDYEILERIVDSMASVARKEKVKIVTGDLKVVEKNSADKIFINTSGIGIREKKLNLSKEGIVPGDKIIISGSIGEHEAAVLCARQHFDLHTKIGSDCAPLGNLIIPLVKKLKDVSSVKFMRDPTRGGLATTLNEIVQGMDFGISINEENIPLREEVQSICELLGFDPLYLANEGKVVVVVSRQEAGNVLAEMKANPLGKKAQIIGEVVASPRQKVIMKTRIKGSRIIDMLVGDQLPRIC